MSFKCYSSLCARVLIHRHRNKAVLNGSPEIPLFFLLFQLLIAVALLHISAVIWPNKIAIPKLDIHVGKKLIPVVSVSIAGLVFNTLCLRDVEASFFQVFVKPLMYVTIADTIVISDCARLGLTAHYPRFFRVDEI